MKRFIIFVASFLLLASTSVFAHHNSPEEIYDFITEQLEIVESPHLQTSDTDPSLLEVYTDTILEDVDLVVYVDGLTAEELQVSLDAILEQLATENEVCGYDYDILYDMDSNLFTLIIYVDFCDS